MLDKVTLSSSTSVSSGEKGVFNATYSFDKYSVLKETGYSVDFGDGASISAGIDVQSYGVYMKTGVGNLSNKAKVSVNGTSGRDIKRSSKFRPCTY